MSRGRPAATARSASAWGGAEGHDSPWAGSTGGPCGRTRGGVAGPPPTAPAPPRGGARGPAPDALVDAVAGVVEAWSAFDDPKTNPAFVLLTRPPRPGLYWRGGRGGGAEAGGPPGRRGAAGGVPPAALASLRGERPDRWLLFETNQGTDDHVIADPREARPRTSVSIAGEVAAPPRTFPGGHVVFPLRWREALDVVAYEPSKQFRRVVRALAPGDRVRVVGSIRETPRSLNLEKLELVSAAVVVAPVGNPRCPRCSRRMKSSGAVGPYRCRRCGARRARSAAGG